MLQLKLSLKKQGKSLIRKSQKSIKESWRYTTAAVVKHHKTSIQKKNEKDRLRDKYHVYK